MMNLYLNPQNISPVLLNAQGILQRYPRAIAFTTAVALSTPWMIDNYAKYMSLGEGGFPYNPIGWLMALAAWPFGRETVSTKQYQQDPNKETWLGDIPERRGERPATGWHPIPHRQLVQMPDAVMREKLDKLFAKLSVDNSSLVELLKSPHERHVQGMHIRSSIPAPHAAAQQSLREIGHIHPPDHSMHFVLSPQDCKLVIEKGWGERHPLSGVNKYVPLPKEYLMIYGPRNDEDLAIIEGIIKASIGFMTNSRSVV